jgi:hypothetical protein
MADKDTTANERQAKLLAARKKVLEKHNATNTHTPSLFYIVEKVSKQKDGWGF